MSRIERLGLSQVSGAARDIFRRKIAERGSLPNMYRVFAHRPWILSTLDAHLAAVMGSGTVPLKLKEMLAAQTSLANGCRYGVEAHVAAAERLGVTRAELESLLDPDDGPFTDAERAALRFGLEMTQDAERVGDSVFDDLRRHFEEPEIVEIAGVVGLVTYVNRFTQALRVEPTAVGEGVET